VQETLDAAAVHRWCGGGLASLRAHQDEIDELNVYPVPDGDTGTNLVLTLTSAQQALLEPSDESTGNPLGRAMRKMARGALLGARGNSGVIVSQILRGMADTFAMSVAVRGGELARALRTATEAAYAAVARPVEGTVLSVVAAAAEGAGRIASDDLVVTARAAAKAAAEALARTPQQLPVLARAGVVDAGGRGLVLLLEALVDALSNRSPAAAGVAASTDTDTDVGGQIPAPDDGAAVAVAVALDGRSSPAAGDGHNPAVDDGTAVGAAFAQSEAAAKAAADRHGPAFDRPSGPDPHADAGPPVPIGSALAGPPPPAFGYEVQYLLDAPAGAIDPLRHALGAIGDSLVVVGTGDDDQPTWNVHVHVAVGEVGAAIEAGIAAGRPYNVSVTALEDRIHLGPIHAHPHEPQGTGRAAERPLDPDSRGAVVVADGDGLTALFAAEGATVVGRNPSTAEMLAAILATGAARVVLLPNDANTHAVASSAAREAGAAGVRVSVVPTRSPVQALAALAVRDAQRRFDDDVIAMAEAAGACRFGEVCTAGREAFTMAGRCRPGDLLGLVDREVLVIGDDLEQVCRQLLDRMLGGGGELATLVLGVDAPAELADKLRGHATRTWPFVELQCYAGGQPRYHLLVGVE
jgi:dihydroxyacetone kinase-like predicted kinase